MILPILSFPRLFSTVRRLLRASALIRILARRYSRASRWLAHGHSVLVRIPLRRLHSRTSRNRTCRHPVLVRISLRHLHPGTSRQLACRHSVLIRIPLRALHPGTSRNRPHRHPVLIRVSLGRHSRASLRRALPESSHRRDRRTSIVSRYVKVSSILSARVFFRPAIFLLLFLFLRFRQPLFLPVDLHKFLTGDCLFLDQEFRQFIQKRPVLLQELLRLLITVFEQLHHFRIHISRRIIAAVHNGPAVQISALYRFQSHQPKLFTHTVLCHHGAGDIGRLLDIVRRACGHCIKYDLLRRTAR